MNMQGIQQQAANNSTASNTALNSARGADYVVFQRMPQQAFSRAGLEKATAAKLKLEHYYKKAVDDVVERNARSVSAVAMVEWTRCEATAMKGSVGRSETRRLDNR